MQQGKEETNNVTPQSPKSKNKKSIFILSVLLIIVFSYIGLSEFVRMSHFESNGLGFVFLEFDETQEIQTTIGQESTANENAKQSIIDTIPSYTGTDTTIQLLIEQKKRDIIEMEDAQLSVFAIRDLLLALIDAANEDKTQTATLLEYSQAMDEIKETAFYCLDLLYAKEREIQEFEEITGYDTHSVWDMYFQATHALELEQYEDAKNIAAKITPALNALQEEQTRADAVLRSQSNKFIAWIIFNKESILIMALLFIPLFIFGAMSVRSHVYHRQIKDLLIEKQVLEDLLKSAQEEYYHKKTIPEKEYTIQIEAYKNRLEKITTLLPQLQKKILATMWKVKWKTKQYQK